MTLPAVRTEALKGVHPVNAGPSVSAGVADAVINIFMTVHATETRITEAGEVACWLADALPSRTTDIRRYLLNSTRVIGRYGHGAAINHLTGAGLAVLFGPFARLSLEAFRTSAVEVSVHAVACGPILARVRVAGI